jgi:hypothetical protein
MKHMVSRTSNYCHDNIVTYLLEQFYQNVDSWQFSPSTNILKQETNKLLTKGIRHLQTSTVFLKPNTRNSERNCGIWWFSLGTWTFHIQWNPVKKILKIPRKSYFSSGKFLKRVILMKHENFGAFLSQLLRREIFLAGFFLSEFHCICSIYITKNMAPENTACCAI